jgi:ABC-2 type transport system ATP-binding protein
MNNPMTNEKIIVTDLTKRFGHFTAVNRISFSIKSGEILGFLGPNGAGKTTTIKMMIGLLKVTSGTIMINNLNAEHHRKQIKAVTGYMSQKFSLYPLLNSLENIEFFGGISGVPRKTIKARLTEIRSQYDPAVLTQKVMDIPPGIKQRIALFVCLLPDPDIIFLDEPTSGVDPQTRRSFWQEIYQLKQHGKTILVSTHNLDEVEYADRMIIIHQGSIIMAGEPDALKKQQGKSSIEELFKDAILSHTPVN